MEENIKIPPLPSLTDVSTKFDLNLTRELVDKIEYVCRELPTLEWSGTLFYKVEGSFENEDLVLTAVDMLVQDIGSAAATEFTPSPDIGYYMATHDLLDCQMGLIHSHNSMATFFSGTDQATLKSEGADRNHFLSLIVNNAGTYTAKITRKIHYKEKTLLSYDYQTFREEEVREKDLLVETDNITVEAFALIIKKEGRSSEFSELDEIIKSLRAKNAAKPVASIYGGYGRTTYGGYGNYGGNSGYKKEVSAGPANMAQQEIPFPAAGGTKKETKVLSLTKYEEGDEVYIEEPEGLQETQLWGEKIPYGKVRFNTEKVQEVVRKILTGAPIVGNSIKPDKFVKGMEHLYSRAFDDDKEAFTEWAGNYLEFLMWHTQDEALNKMGTSIEESQAILAFDVCEELEKFPENEWLKAYKDILSAFIL